MGGVFINRWSIPKKFSDQWGTPITGDFDGDGRDDIGSFQIGNWDFEMSGCKTHFIDTHTDYGFPIVFPIVGDWNGDGVLMN